MEINHQPDMAAVTPSSDEMTVFQSLTVGDSFRYFGLPVTPPRVTKIVDHDEFGRVVVSEAEGETEVLYEVDGCLWMNTLDPSMAETHENIPYPIESLRLVE